MGLSVSTKQSVSGYSILPATLVFTRVRNIPLQRHFLLLQMASRLLMNTCEWSRRHSVSPPPRCSFRPSFFFLSSPRFSLHGNDARRHPGLHEVSFNFDLERFRSHRLKDASSSNEEAKVKFVLLVCLFVFLSVVSNDLNWRKMRLSRH